MTSPLGLSLDGHHKTPRNRLIQENHPTNRQIHRPCEDWVFPLQEKQLTHEPQMTQVGADKKAAPATCGSNA